MEPPGPVIESERQNVTLHCEVVNGNPPILTRARWFLDGDLLKQLPDCNTTVEQDESSTGDYNCETRKRRAVIVASD